MNRDKTKSDRGFSLVEVAIVLAIVGLVIAGVWTAASSVSQNRREAKASEQLLQIVQNMRRLYDGQLLTTPAPTYAQLETAGVFPTEMIGAAAGAPQNPFGGGAQVDRMSDTSFSVLFGGLNQAACVKLAMSNMQNTNAIGLSVVYINGGSALALPVTLSAAQGRCQDDNANYITWGFNLRA